MSFEVNSPFSLCILIVPRWGNPHIEGINLIQRNFVTGQPNIWFHTKRRGKLIFDLWVEPAKRNVWIGLIVVK